MIRAKMSLLLFSLFVAVWVFIPARYSNADRVKTETETYNSSSDMDSAPTVSEYKREYRESHQSSAPGSEEKRTKVETYRSSDVIRTTQKATTSISVNAGNRMLARCRVPRKGSPR